MENLQQKVVGEFLNKVVDITTQLPQPEIQKAIDTLFTTWTKGRIVYAIGNGGSASTASHFACDLAKCTIVPNKPPFKVLSLCDNMALFSAWTNDFGFGSVFTGQMKPWLQEGDTLIVYSVHGGSGDGDAGPWSQNLVKAVQLAKEKGAKVIGFTGFSGGAVAKLADVSIVVPINQEPLGTGVVESFHVVLHHLLCVALRQKMEAYNA